MKLKKLSPLEKEEITRAVLLLRFRRTDPGPLAYKFMAYAKIAKALNLTVNEVTHLCRKAQSVPDPLKRLRDPARKLEQHHADYLLSERTLERWAGKTLPERSALFTAAFLGKTIAVTTLRRLYLRHKIKRKKVVKRKVVPPHQEAAYQRWKEVLVGALEQVKARGLKLMWLDETNFTKLALQTIEWSRRLTNLSVDQQDVYTGYRSVIATISEERGVELISIQAKAVTEYDFLRYLVDLSRANDKRPFALFMDNLSVHKTNAVKLMYERLQITPLFNIPYHPDNNPIEACFSQVKRHFSSRRLHCLANSLEFDREGAIREAFGKIEIQHVKNNVNRSVRALS